VGIDRKGNARLGVSKALADRDNINPAGDELTGVRMAKRAEQFNAALETGYQTSLDIQTGAEVTQSHRLGLLGR
jgi:hypothetical protein